MDRFIYKTSKGHELDSETEKKLRWCQKNHMIGNVIFINSEIYKITEIVYNCETEETVILLDEQHLSAQIYKKMLNQ